jgi:uncharacterized protein YodC (DUF2158 family)
MDNMAEGDLVVLRAGGPVMVVEDVGRTDGVVNCVWFVEREVRRDAFHRDALLAYLGKLTAAALGG